MNQRLYTILTVLLLFATRVLAQADWIPVNPGEPGKKYRVAVVADPSNAATTTGTGYYDVNTTVSISSSINDTQWQLTGWEDENGDEVIDYQGNAVGTRTSFTYRVTNADVRFIAKYVAVPTSTISLSAQPGNSGQTFTLRINGRNITQSTHKAGTTLTINAENPSNWTFVHWKNAATDEVVSTLASFSYTTTENDVNLVAYYKFTPGSPADPSVAKVNHRVYFTTEPAAANGRVTSSSSITTPASGYPYITVKESASYTLYANANSGWQFSHWSNADGETVGNSSTYTNTMGTENEMLTGHFVFNPNSPSNPSADNKNRLTLYALTTALYRGSTIEYPIYLENSRTVKALSLTMTLPEGLTVNTATIRTTSRTSAFTIIPSLSGQTLTLDITGGTLIDGNNGPIVYLPITATEAMSDGTYDLTFTANSVTMDDETTAEASYRQGILNVSTLDEGDVEAIFTSEQVMNRVQFNNQSTEGCQTYTWDFGDGQTSTEANPRHDYAAPGTYNVTLTAHGIVKTSTLAASITIAEPALWTVGGDFTLDSESTGIRNFTSMHEAMTMLSQCRPTGNITLHATAETVFAFDATTAEALALLTTMSNKFSTNGRTMTISTANEATASTIAITTNAMSSDLQSAFAFIAGIRKSNVNTTINGAAFDTSILAAINSETVCAETATTALNLTSLSSSANVTVEWEALLTQAASDVLTGFLVSGMGNLPAMTIANSGTTKQTVNYHITYKLNDVEIHTAVHSIIVKPLLEGRTLTLTQPADGTTVDFGTRSFSWTNQNELATNGYTLYITRTDNEPNTQRTFTPMSNSASVYLEPGASYTWYVVAHGDCDDLTSAEASITVKAQADLVVESVEAPEQCKALKDIAITATIRNAGLGTTQLTSWTDALYYSTSASLSSPIQVKTVSHSGALAPDASYTVTFNVTAPDANLGKIWYFVKTDVNDAEDESNDDNNTTAAAAYTTIADSYVDPADYEALKTLYNAANGEIWTRKWNIATNAINSTAWPGVTFDSDGCVTAISLSNNNMSGILPTTGFTLPRLKTLNLSYNNLRGNVAAFVSGCTSLITLNMNHCQITALDSALPSTITSVDLGYQYYNKSTSELQTLFGVQEMEMGNTIDNIVLTSLLSYDHANGDFSLRPNLRLYSTSNTYLGMLTHNGSAYELKLSGDYKQPTGTNVIIEAYGGVAIYSRMYGSLSWITGDANADGIVSLPDAQQTINRILRKDVGNFNFIAANTYSADDIINIQDMVKTVNLFIEEEEEESPAKGHQMAASRNDASSDGFVYTTANGLYLSANTPVAALDITLSGVRASQMALDVSRSDYQMYTHATANGTRVVIVSTSGKELGAGITRLLRLSASGVGVTRIEAVDANASVMSVGTSDDGTTGINSINTDSSLDGTTYDLQGRKINHERALPAGIYIRNGRKIIIK